MVVFAWRSVGSGQLSAVSYQHASLPGEAFPSSPPSPLGGEGKVEGRLTTLPVSCLPSPVCCYVSHATLACMGYAQMVTYALLFVMATVQVREYLDNQGRSPFAAWFDGLNVPAAVKVTAALYQLGAGNWSGVKGVGAGVFERKIDFGPGYRVYFGKDGETIVVLLGGSSKKRQQQAIEAAQERWVEYHRRKSDQRR